MRTMMIFAALLAGTSLAACNVDRAEDNEANMAVIEPEATTGQATGAASDWPEGTRIVEVDNVYYRVEPSGTRIRLAPGDSTIVVEDGIRYRVDPGGTRVRINDEGAAISVGPGGVDATVLVDGGTRVTVNSQ